MECHQEDQVGVRDRGPHFWRSSHGSWVKVVMKQRDGVFSGGWDEFCIVLWQSLRFLDVFLLACTNIC